MPILCSCFNIGAKIADKALEENPELLERVNNGEDLAKLGKIFAKKCRALSSINTTPCNGCMPKDENSHFADYLVNKNKQNTLEYSDMQIISTTTPIKRVA